jgi:ribosomal protein S18 acetylase RimI-like enzyme
VGAATAVRRARPADLPQIVAIHEAAFSGFFLTLLGAPFLRELYRAFMADPTALCLVCEVTGPTGVPELAGFVVGTVTPESFFRKLLLKRGARFALAAVPALLRHPRKVFPRLLGAVRYRGERPINVPDAALLSSIGVHPQAARRGLGGTLVAQFCQHAAQLGAQRVYLTTDHEGNAGANSLYQRAGFDLAGKLVRPDGRIMNTYVRVLTTGHAIAE